MNKNFYKILAHTMIFIFILSFYSVGYAETKDIKYCNPNPETHSDPGKFLPLIQCGSAGQPCCDFKEAAILVNRVINWFLAMSVSIAAVGFLIAGAKILMNPENDSERGAAKEMFQKTVVGLLIILGAWLFINTLITALVKTDIDALRYFK